MKKRINRLRFLNIIIYSFFIITFIPIQLLYFNNIHVSENNLGLIIFGNLIVISYYIMKNIYFTNFMDKKVNKKAIINILNKYLIFLLMNILITNKIDFTFFYMVVMVLFFILIVFDIVYFIKFIKVINSNEVINGYDELIESRENRLKKWKNNKDFRDSQCNLLIFYFSIFLMSAATRFTDFSNSSTLIKFSLLFAITLFLGFTYCRKLSKYINIKWYEYILLEFFYILVIMLNYFNLIFLIGIAVIPLIPFMIKQNKVRKEFLSSDDIPTE